MDEAVLYKVDEAASVLRLSRSVIYELIRSNQLRSVQIGRARRIPVQAVRDYVDGLANESA